MCMYTVICVCDGSATDNTGANFSTFWDTVYIYIYIYICITYHMVFHLSPYLSARGLIYQPELARDDRLPEG